MLQAIQTIMTEIDICRFLLAFIDIKIYRSGYKVVLVPELFIQLCSAATIHLYLLRLNFIEDLGSFFTVTSPFSDFLVSIFYFDK